jgi:hypothetical protein
MGLMRKGLRSAPCCALFASFPQPPDGTACRADHAEVPLPAPSRARTGGGTGRAGVRPAARSSRRDCLLPSHHIFRVRKDALFEWTLGTEEENASAAEAVPASCDSGGRQFAVGSDLAKNQAIVLLRPAAKDTTGS